MSLDTWEQSWAVVPFRNNHSGQRRFHRFTGNVEQRSMWSNTESVVMLQEQELLCQRNYSAMKLTEKALRGFPERGPFLVELRVM